MMEKVEKNIKELEREKSNFETMVQANMETARHWKHALVSIIFAWLLTVAGFIWYIAQYDYVSYNEAQGIYAMIDANGNIVSQDITPEQWEAFIEWQRVLNDGKD